jgi:hypothetical protein
MKKLLIVVALLVAAIVVVATWSNNTQPAVTESALVAERASQSAPEHSHMKYAAKERVPAYYETLPTALPRTLSPDIFSGNQKLAYQAAKEIPQVLAQMPCYCHCDRGHGHKSLHSCFESEHGENCGICIGEALMAHNLQKRGISVTEIRKQIIAAYGQSQ